MSPAELHETLRSVPARVIASAHLRTAVVDGRAPDALESIFECFDRGHLAELWPSLPPDAIEAFLDCNWEDAEAHIEDHKLFGFLVEVATPSPNKHGSYSWGMYTSKLFYADTFDGALEAALPWAQAVHSARGGT